MSCLTRAQLAASATGVLDDRAERHVGTCLVCRRALDEERTGRELARRLVVPSLAPRRHDELAAEILAIADRAPLPAPRRRWMLGGAMLASALSAAAVAVLVLHHPATTIAPSIAVASPTENIEVTGEHGVIAHVEAPPRIANPASPASGNPANPEVASVPEHPRHARASAEQQVVIGGQSTNQRIEIDRDDVTLQRADDPSKLAFQAGWIAMRANNYRGAIAAFDGVTSSAFAEEAAYWSMIAARRAGDEALAEQKLQSFTQRFPHSIFSR